MGEEAAEVAADLVQACKDSEVRVCACAALALGKLGARTRAVAVPELQRLLDDKQDGVRRAAYRSLLRLAQPVLADAPALRKLLADRKGFPEKRMYATLALGTLGAEAVASLASAARDDEDPRVLLRICLVLGELKPRTQEVGQALTRLVAHTDPAIRRAAANVVVPCQ